MSCKDNVLESLRKRNGYGRYDGTFFGWAGAEVDCMFKLFLHWQNLGHQKKRIKWQCME